jgi:hypothetical protein
MANAPTAANEPVRCRLGVLFVHGIGEQREGETLVAFGEPLIAWLRQWIAGRGSAALRRRDGGSRPAAVTPVAPNGLEARDTSIADGAHVRIAATLVAGPQDSHSPRRRLTLGTERRGCSSRRSRD